MSGYLNASLLILFNKSNGAWFVGLDRIEGKP